MNQTTSIFLVLAFSILFISQTEADGFNIPELFTTLNSSVYIPCYVDTGTDYEYRTPISWTRVGYDGFLQIMMAPDFVPPSNVKLHASRINSFDSLVVRQIVKSLSGTYTCHTDKGNASTLVHVLDGDDWQTSTLVHGLDGESPPIESQHFPNPCSEGFDLVHGKCLYYSNEKKNFYLALRDCAGRTSSLITFKDVKDLMSLLISLQKSGPTHYQFKMWTGYTLIDESNSRLGALQNDVQVSPMLDKANARITSCSYLDSVQKAAICSLTRDECLSEKYNFLCEQPTL